MHQCKQMEKGDSKVVHSSDVNGANFPGQSRVDFADDSDRDRDRGASDASHDRCGDGYRNFSLSDGLTIGGLPDLLQPLKTWSSRFIAGGDNHSDGGSSSRDHYHHHHHQHHHHKHCIDEKHAEAAEQHGNTDKDMTGSGMKVNDPLTACNTTTASLCYCLRGAGAMLFRNVSNRTSLLALVCLFSLSIMLVFSSLLSDGDINGYEAGEDETTRLLREFRVEVTRNIRNTTTHALCAVEELNHISRLNSEQRKTLDAQILVDDAHGFMYCFVPKVACSNWKRVIKYMNGKVPDLETPMKMDHHKDLVFLNDFNDAEVDYRLKNYFKFMFVRDPTERLLSAYRNKFGENIGTYNLKYGPKIIQKYRRPGERIEGDDQTRITFEEFLRFLVDSDTRRMDPHWRPMWELCQPCAVKYDFIGSFEQLQEDATHVLERVRGDSDAYFPKRQSWYKPTTDDKISKELNRVQPKYMKQVVDKYARDYMLFGYNPPVSEVSRPKL